jgi:hypothetical protein
MAPDSIESINEEMPTNVSLNDGIDIPVAYNNDAHLVNNILESISPIVQQNRYPIRTKNSIDRYIAEPARSLLHRAPKHKKL